MDASQYKDYVLVLLFVKYVSDKYAGQKNAMLDVPEGGRFADMVLLKGDKEIGDKINKIIGRLAEANDLKGIIDVADFNDPDKLGKGKEMVDRLSNLIGIFDNPGLDFRGNRAEGDDLLGDAYEYLMRHFATESGKSKGQFYTPAEVSRIMAKVIGIGSAKASDQTIYDPACGSGSLLLKAHDEARSGTGLDLAIYGQEMDNATSALARMNMILHDCPTAEIWKDNSLSAPHFKNDRGQLKTHDFVVANPPFSTKAWSNGFNPEEDEFHRFKFGDQLLIPPDKNGDYAFLLHILSGCDLFTNEAICSFNKLQANAEFLYYILGRTDFSLYGKQAVKGYTLNKESLKIIEVPLPPLPEQTAIATVLSEMDGELAALEQRREKTRALKQAMMQELLTGRTRLV
jgi:type I restriction enzyme M protein